jgi:isoquinoline 1-oxidoreductase alpha subunit
VGTFKLNINGKKHTVKADLEMPLLWVLRDLLSMTGTKYGCGVGVCGACTVHEGRRAVRSCQIKISEAANKSYTTIEGLSPGCDHPCQRAWLEEDVAQCGFCQAGMIMTAAALIRENPSPTDAEIDAAMSNSVCRCGTYQRMRKAIHRAASEVRKPGKSGPEN